MTRAEFERLLEEYDRAQARATCWPIGDRLRVRDDARAAVLAAFDEAKRGTDGKR